MTHHHPGEDIQDLLDGRLVSARRAEIEAHVADCPRCRETLATLSWARQAAARLPMHDPPPELPTQVAHALDRVARTYAAYTSAALQLDTATGDGPALQAFFARHGITFATRVFNLDMMGYHLLGGRIHALGQGPSALFVYQDASGRALLCQMFEGTLTQLPAGGETREHNRIAFRVYRSGALTLVFWQEGAVVCVLTSDAPTEQVIQLAYAKSVKV